MSSRLWPVYSTWVFTLPLELCFWKHKYDHITLVNKNLYLLIAHRIKSKAFRSANKAFYNCHQPIILIFPSPFSLTFPALVLSGWPWTLQAHVVAQWFAFASPLFSGGKSLHGHLLLTFSLQPRHLPSEAYLDCPMPVIAPSSVHPQLDVNIFVSEHTLVFLP